MEKKSRKKIVFVNDTQNYFTSIPKEVGFKWKENTVAFVNFQGQMEELSACFL